LSKEKSQQFAQGKPLTFLEQAYEIVYVKGGIDGLRRLYFHLRKGKKQSIRIRKPLSPWQCKAKAGIPDIHMIRQKPYKSEQGPALCLERAGPARFLAARLS